MSSKFTFSLSDNYLISLPHRLDRREGFVQNIIEHGFNIQSFKLFNAIEDKNFGGLGCAKSHFKCLATSICLSNNPFVCIMEDDFRFRYSINIAEMVVNKILDEFFDCKVILLAGTSVVTSLDNQLVSLPSRHRLVQIFESQSTSGYICKREFLPDLLQVFLKSVVLLDKFKDSKMRAVYYDRFAIDQQWKSLQRLGGWYAGVPMLGEQFPSHSDIVGAFSDYSATSS
jgi:GR25 family glycosyltransferase involved in LPS biosynthesis